MVRRLTAREKLVDEESLRQCIRVAGSPAHRFYADLANAQPVAIPSQLFDQFDDDEEDSVETETAVDAVEES
jgi:hypothetical protein